MSANVTDINEYRAWKRAKQAWKSAHTHPSESWEKLSETQRVQWKRAFERGTRRR